MVPVHLLLKISNWSLTNFLVYWFVSVQLIKVVLLIESVAWID